MKETETEATLEGAALEHHKSNKFLELAKKGASIVDLVNELISEAHQERASDIHINPNETQVRVRLRVDGVLHDKFSCDKNIHSEIISRIKVLAGLRTDEHQAAQDGRFRISLSGGQTIPGAVMFDTGDPGSDWLENRPPQFLHRYAFASPVRCKQVGHDKRRIGLCRRTVCLLFRRLPY